MVNTAFLWQFFLLKDPVVALIVANKPPSVRVNFAVTTIDKADFWLVNARPSPLH